MAEWRGKGSWERSSGGGDPAALSSDIQVGHVYATCGGHVVKVIGVGNCTVSCAIASVNGSDITICGGEEAQRGDTWSWRMCGDRLSLHGFESESQWQIMESQIPRVNRGVIITQSSPAPAYKYVIVDEDGLFWDGDDWDDDYGYAFIYTDKACAVKRAESLYEEDECEEMYVYNNYGTDNQEAILVTRKKKEGGKATIKTVKGHRYVTCNGAILERAAAMHRYALIKKGGYNDTMHGRRLKEGQILILTPDEKGGIHGEGYDIMREESSVSSKAKSAAIPYKQKVVVTHNRLYRTNRRLLLPR